MCCAQGLVVETARAGAQRPRASELSESQAVWPPYAPGILLIGQTHEALPSVLLVCMTHDLAVFVPKLLSLSMSRSVTYDCGPWNELAHIVTYRRMSNNALQYLPL